MQNNRRLFSQQKKSHWKIEKNFILRFKKSVESVKKSLIRLKIWKMKCNPFSSVAKGSSSHKNVAGSENAILNIYYSNKVRFSKKYE